MKQCTASVNTHNTQIFFLEKKLCVVRLSFHFHELWCSGLRFRSDFVWGSPGHWEIVLRHCWDEIWILSCICKITCALVCFEALTLYRKGLTEVWSHHPVGQNSSVSLASYSWWSSLCFRNVLSIPNDNSIWNVSWELHGLHIYSATDMTVSM